MNRYHGRTAVLILVAFAVGGLLLPNLRVSWNGPAAMANPPDLSRLSADEVYARAAAQAAPAVVNIDTEARVRVRGFFLDDDMFGPRFRRVSSSGSGVVVSADGDIITNDHVVGNAEKIAVTMPDGRKLTGRVIGSDHSTDVALIHVDGGNLPTARLGTSHGLIPGQLAVALGNPLGLRFTVTHGIVSALGRPVKIGDRVYENLIQTDCAINPGNSGGALVDHDGKVIGINALVMEAANGVGFAIPIDTALRIAKELKQYGKVKRPWTGIFAVAVNESIRRYFGLARAEGAIVEGVVPGSPADQAGIERGDIIIELDGKAIRDDDDLRHITEALRIGSRTRIVVMRGDQRAPVDLQIRESP